jgi:outer membrane protein assembly factor BamB
MKRGLKITSLSLCLLALPACSWVNSYFVGSDNTLPPAELKTIEQTAGVRQVWSNQTSSGTDGNYFQFQLASSGSGQERRLFTAGADGDITAINAASGARLWRTDTDLPLSAGVGLSEDLALAGSIDGDVIALRQSDGSEAWRVRLSSEILTPPVSAAGIIIVRTVDGTFAALSVLDGSIVWTSQYTVPALTLRGASRPLIAEGLVIAGLDNGKLQLLALDTGALIGERRIAPPRGRTDLDRMVDIDAELRLLDSELYIAAYQGNVNAIDLQGGQLLWSRDFSSYAGLEVDAAQVYIIDAEDSVWAMDRRSGSSLWQQDELRGRRLSPPALSGKYLIVGDFEGYLHWLDKTTGRIVGRTQSGSDRISSAPLTLNETVFALDHSGSINTFTTAP